MLVPLSWLKKYVKIDLSVEEFVRRMIMSGTAVEGYEDCGAEISNVVVGKLVEIVKHPNSDHLNICQVDVGGETPIQIVTGADNMSVGDLVPVALHDSHLPGTGRSGTHEYSCTTIFSFLLVRKSSFQYRHFNQVLLRGLNAFCNSSSYLVSFT